MGSRLGFVLRRHDRDPNVSSHIRIPAVLWDKSIKSWCVCVLVLMFVLIFLMVWSQSRAAIRM